MKKKENFFKKSLKTSTTPLARANLLESIEKLKAEDFPEPPLACKSLAKFIYDGKQKKLQNESEEDIEK